MISEKIMIIDKEYALVDATARLNTDLRDYEHEINNAAIITFGNDLIEVIVYQFSFIISIRAEGDHFVHPQCESTRMKNTNRAVSFSIA